MEGVVGKAFIGPFKAVAVDKVVVQNDGAVYVTLRDNQENVLGLVTDREVLSLMLSKSIVVDASPSVKRSVPLVNSFL
jgi:hypothetical protein